MLEGELLTRVRSNKVAMTVNILGPRISLLNINGKMELYSESASMGPGEIQEEPVQRTFCQIPARELSIHIRVIGSQKYRSDFGTLLETSVPGV